MRAANRVHRLETNQVICDYCLEWHFHSMDFLGGAVPKGCQICGTPWEALRDRTPGNAVRMYVVPKDGIQQMLCDQCILPYALKRSDIYRDTTFWKDPDGKIAA
jgi:hypothetical protein